VTRGFPYVEIVKVRPGAWRYRARTAKGRELHVSKVFASASSARRGARRLVDELGSEIEIRESPRPTRKRARRAK
jgi:hypothetical protein